MGELIDKLTEYGKQDIYPFHMPGHKRCEEWKVNPYNYDITEINGFDDLHNPNGVLKNLCQRLGDMYQCKDAFLLTNGSTSGILAAISAVVDCNDAILIGRNCHKSVYNAAFLRKAKVEYIYPESDKELGISLAINPSSVEKKLKNTPSIKAVVITSPTYEGVISDIVAIAQTVHKFGAILIVDGAHGAHVGLEEGKLLTVSGADIVVMSLHKTLPAFTQTAVVCVNGNAKLVERVKKYFDIYETSSPSYLLMCGVEKCLDVVQMTSVLGDYYRRLDDFRTKCKSLKRLFLYEPESSFDRGKIVIGTSRCSIGGIELKNLLLKEYKIELEMASKEYVLAMTSCGDSQDGFDRLWQALEEVDTSLLYLKKNSIHSAETPKKVMEIWEAEAKFCKDTPLDLAMGCISGSFVYAYPPGIPWLVPGEVISQDMINRINYYISEKFDIRGIEDNLQIQVVER